ncbi:MAG: CapA family protein [Chloroflexi bacterium]|nr:CapA family protein [Chloroflexota bacterium]
MAGSLRLFLCGDIMTGRGIDQALPYSSSPELYERYVKDARQYVTLAARKNGLIPTPLSFEAVWGDALDELENCAPEVRIGNLETSLTTTDSPWPGKGIHYRMHPTNAACLAAARLDCCSLANNHVLDWGREGLVETLATLQSVGIAYAGAGKNREEATTPVTLVTRNNRRVIVVGAGSTSSGIPSAWAAQQDLPGINLLIDDPEVDAIRLIAQIRQIKQQHDIVVVSIHWGGNWGYEIPASHVRLAHLLIDSGDVDIVHGHSSHHAIAMEVYRGKLILYGCGDFITDYEGISGHEEYRGDIGVMYFPDVDAETGDLLSLTMIPTTMQRFQVRYASEVDIRWLLLTLNRENARFGLKIKREGQHTLQLDFPRLVQ